jgi:hypothetical protein
VQIYAYADRLGGQMAGAIQAGAPANCLVIFPFFKGLGDNGYTLPESEWFSVIHDILQDINSNVVNGICNQQKKIILASFSSGPYYLNRFLGKALEVIQAKDDPTHYPPIAEIWDFDSDVADEFVQPQGVPLRAYWQTDPNQADPPKQDSYHRTEPVPKTLILLPKDPSWTNFPPPSGNVADLPLETPPLDTQTHHEIRDTMFLDAAFNVKKDNPEQ